MRHPTAPAVSRREALLDLGVEPETADKIERAIAVVRRLVETDVLLSVAWSGGKDSTAALILALLGHAEAAIPGRAAVPLVITTADTGIENPMVHAHWEETLRALRSWAKRTGRDVRVRVARPSPVSSWTVKVVSGCGLPTFADSKHRKCSIDLKRTPAERSLRRLVPELVAELDARLDAAPPDFLRLAQLRDRLAESGPTVIIGTRFGESASRDRRMAERGDVAAEARRNDDGLPTLPLIADFTLDEVWELLALAGGDDGPLPSFLPDFSATRDLYRDATGECVIVAGAKDSSAACGARFGCALCTAVGRDKSMETMLEQAKHGWMRPLNRLRDYLQATRGDLSRRRWVGRTIHPETGHVRIGPDAYSSKECEALLGIMLTIDADERRRAETLAEASDLRSEGIRVPWPDPHLAALDAEGRTDAAYLARMIRPRFRLVTEEQLLLVDFLWGRYGVHKPFRALWIDREVKRGRRYEIPEIDAVPSAEHPPTRWTAVPEDPFLDDPLFDPIEWSLLDRPGANLPAVGPKTVTVDPEETETIEVFEEAAAFILDYEVDRLIEDYHDRGHAPIAAVMFYLRFGAIGVPKGRLGEIGLVARRNLRLRHCGLDPSLSCDELPMEATISDAEHSALLRSVREARATETARGGAARTGRAGKPDSRQSDLFAA